MENQDFENTNQSQVPWTLLVTLSLVLVLIALSLVFYFWLSNVEPVVVALEEEVEVEQDTNEPFDTLKGTVYLTLANPLGRNGRDVADTEEYVFNIETSSLTKALPNDDWIKITSSLSPDSGRLAYMSSPYEGDSPEINFYPTTVISQLYTYDYLTQTKQPVTDDQSVGKRGPKWSPNGQFITFYSADSEKYFAEGLVDNPNDWFIHLSNLVAGTTEVVGRGVQPFWSPDGRYILYVGEGGVYRYDLSGGSSQRVYSFNEIATSLMKFGVSDDGTQFAWSHQTDNNIHIYKIESWEPFVMTYEERVSIFGYAGTNWPHFSSDNRYVVYQWIDRDPETGDFFDSSLNVYDRETQRWKELLNLTPFRTDVVFVNDFVD